MAPTLPFFDSGKATRLCTDASRQGLGFVLQQKTANDTWTLIQAGSRFLTGPETRYAVIELELLAVSWATLKYNMFLAGLPHFKIITDHNPLIPILNNHRLDEIENPRLQRLKTRIMAYNFTAEWRKGKQNDAPDALSRNPVSDPKPHEMLAEYDVWGDPEMSNAELRAIANDGQESARLQDLRRYADHNPEHQQLRDLIINGFPDHHSQMLEACKRYWSAREHLTLEDDLILHGCRLLIPSDMRQDTLVQLHESHQGSVRTKQRARLTVYWPGIDNDIDNVVLACKTCQDLLPSNTKQPIISKPKPTRPFQEVAADFCSYAGQDHLILVDCYSDWPTIVLMGHDTTAPRLIKAVRQSFCRTGIPATFWSDGGPQFTSKKFRDFATQWGFTHIVSTPRYPQSNGRVEATVKSMKIIRTSWNSGSLNEDKLCRALLQYRNTPSRKDGLSPAQKLYGRPVQDMLPAHRRSFAEEWQRSANEAEQLATSNLEKAESAYNAHAHSLPDIRIGSNVAIQNSETKLWDIYGIVTNIGKHRRYYVKTHSGRVLVRNRRFLRRRVPASIPTANAKGQQQDQSQPSQRHSSRQRNPPKRLAH